ncbi:MAG: CAP domain-containing protein [Bacteroidota bacterium]
MIKKTRNILLLFSLMALSTIMNQSAFAQKAVKQGNPVPTVFCIDAREMNLYHMINDYRKQNNLPPIPLSKSLSYVADLHAKDLFAHHPDQGACNFHSWSNKGFWAPFCYPKDENKKNSVWDKPRELTKYASRGYEIVYWENNPLVTDTVMMVWKTEEYFNSFLLNTGKWQGKPWNAIGIAVYENYACAWFGEVQDPEGAATVCGAAPEPPKKDTLTQPVKPVKKPVVETKKGKAVTPDANRNDTLVKKVNDTTSVVYYIIVNTLLPKDKANQLANSLKEKGYPDAKLIEKNGKLRVSIMESPDKTAMMGKLKEVKKIYRDAWILKGDKEIK